MQKNSRCEEKFSDLNFISVFHLETKISCNVIISIYILKKKTMIYWIAILNCVKITQKGCKKGCLSETTAKVVRDKRYSRVRFRSGPGSHRRTPVANVSQKRVVTYPNTSQPISEEFGKYHITPNGSIYSLVFPNYAIISS